MINLFLLFAGLGAGMLPTMPPAKTPAPAPQGKQTGEAGKETVLIDPAKRSADWAAAYHFLQSHQGGIRLQFKLANGQTLENILMLTPMPDGTLIAFQLNTPMGMKYQIVKVEDIDGIITQ